MSVLQRLSFVNLPSNAKPRAWHRLTDFREHVRLFLRLFVLC
jgi:hypothetical protein